ncbi:MAG TPA: hypothetical protein VFY24_12020 [Azospira sp.]|nr:hypothetical protein [Azospira sp.]
MPQQSAALRRCATCERWAGPRAPGDAPDCVAIGSETDSGNCVGGPWDGNPRRARSACGRWLRWRMLSESGVGEGSSGEGDGNA